MMKKINRLLSLLCALFLFGACIPMMDAYAAERVYKVKFRAGDVNTFNTEMLQSYGIEGTENYFSLEVPQGQTIAQVFEGMIGSSKQEQLQMFFERILNENNQYQMNTITEWCEDLYAVISHNEAYVLDYSKMVNPIRYTVYFLDTDSHSQIAVPWIRYVSANQVGNTIQIEPIVIAEYATTNTAVEMTLTEEENQEVRFYYAYVGEYMHVAGEGEGEIVYNDIIREIIVENPEVNGEEQEEANAGGQENPEINPEENQQENPQENPEENPQENQNTTEILESEVPLNPGVTEIEDEEPPLYGNQVLNNPIHSIIFISAILGIIVLFVIIVTVITFNQRRHVNNISDNKNQK